MGPPIAVATGPTAAFGEALIQRRWDETTPPGVDAVSLLAQAQNALKE